MGIAVLVGVASPGIAQSAGVEQVKAGKVYFEQNCAICHAARLGPDNVEIVQQGPSLVGVLGRRAGTGTKFNFTQALRNSGLVWDTATLDRFLADPAAAVPGTIMPMAVAKPEDRGAVIAYLVTLKPPGNGSATAPPRSGSAPPSDSDWQRAAPGVKHHLTVADLPAPFSSRSVGNGPQVVKRPDNAQVSVPPGFTARLFATGLSNPRLLRVAPDHDIFIAETGRNRLRVLRAADGAEAPTENQIFVEGLERPFGVAFYPPGDDPQWLYVANNNSVVRFAYHNGDLKATGAPEVIVPRLSNSSGGHSTRDVAFSLDGKRMFISVGSGSNVADGIHKKTPAEIEQWEAEHGHGAAWDNETNRADILVTDPEGRQPLRTFASGIRNGVGIAVNPITGDLWTSTNERDGLGDDLVPDYISRVREGGYYGWPWYYLGNHEDPRRAGERPDLAGQAIVPDVLIQAHSASLEMTFYPAAKGVAAFPAEYHGDAFAALHGSWNRNTRTGYKIIRVRLHDGIPTGEYEDFMTGFVVDDRSVWGRPVGVAVAHDGALLVTEDGGGTVWRVTPGGR